MNRDQLKVYYNHMLNYLYGLQDDFDANQVPDEAKSHLKEIIEICESDYRIRFGPL
jgi:hypothetical protein